MKIKKVMISFLFSLFIPLTTILALTDKVYIGGENVGIEVKTNGVLVVGLYEVNNDLIASSSGINSGDYIVEINGNKVINIEDFTNEINDNTTNKILDIDSGSIYSSYITGIDRSTNGSIGEKEAVSDSDNRYGTIEKNTNKGIFGKYEYDLSNKKIYEITPKENIKLGKATFLTVTSNDEVKEYSINIDSINLNDNIKNIAFSVTDEGLINETGGIVQGMSGSPIIQDDKIIGVITHVIVNDPKKGYAIFIENMLEEAEKE